jgi:histidine triad (HIT) family protein
VPQSAGADCRFCDILAGGLAAQVVLEDENTLAFLDNRPLFPGHSLLMPRGHIETLADVPDGLLGELFGNARLLSRAMETGLGAQGSFVAINNHVSQSVPHLHVHVVPRTKGDGLRGFFWPRQKYEDDAHAERIAEQLREAVASLRGS